ncbi:MAG: hypothetical protein HJJLKODD_01076 [Phycisphaerae bacterium]|nr:hypothetical protein [Phycisphaerae bacterium]
MNLNSLVQRHAQVVRIMERLSVSTVLLAFSSSILFGCQGNSRAGWGLPDPVLVRRPTPQPDVPLQKQAPKPAAPVNKDTRTAMQKLIAPPGGINRAWKYIVVHHSASAKGNASTFNQAHLARGWDELGYHFVIGNGSGSGDGQIEVGSRWIKQKHGAHCKTADNRYNDYGIGICLVGNFDETQPTAAQLKSLEALVEELMSSCQIPAGNVVGHGQVQGTHTHCPGATFSVANFRQRLNSFAQR